MLLAAGFATGNWVFDYLGVLQYETPACFFAFSSEFLWRWLDHPGGLLLYAGRFLRQFYHYEWLGALVASLVITALGGLLYHVRARCGEKVGIFHTFLPCVGLLALHSTSTLTIGLVGVSGALP